MRNMLKMPAVPDVEWQYWDAMWSDEEWQDWDAMWSDEDMDWPQNKEWPNPTDMYYGAMFTVDDMNSSPKLDWSNPEVVHLGWQDPPMIRMPSADMSTPNSVGNGPDAGDPPNVFSESLDVELSTIVTISADDNADGWPNPQVIRTYRTDMISPNSFGIDPDAGDPPDMFSDSLDVEMSTIVTISAGNNSDAVVAPLQNWSNPAVVHLGSEIRTDCADIITPNSSGNDADAGDPPDVFSESLNVDIPTIVTITVDDKYDAVIAPPTHESNAGDPHDVVNQAILNVVSPLHDSITLMHDWCSTMNRRKVRNKTQSIRRIRDSTPQTAQLNTAVKKHRHKFWGPPINVFSISIQVWHIVV